MSLSLTEFAVAAFGLAVAIAMALMKIIPAVPGHFTVYEWLALGVWILLGVIASRTKRSAAVPAAVQRASSPGSPRK
ncbi:MAG TPA: hypothetical protein VFO46_25685, partial [Candidatus Sulfotelmatobacter sp.]|nr:hypothetical protein [Candidatus Sulfotelmatobacter sp.]